MSENIKQYDGLSWVHVLKWDNGDAVDLRTANAVYVAIILDGESVASVYKECPILNAENGVINLLLVPTETAVAGMYRMEFKVDFGENATSTFPSTGNLWLHIEESYQVE